MSSIMPTSIWATLMAPLGFALGVLYFAALRRTTLLVVKGGVLPAIALTIGRAAAAVGVFGFAAWLGVGPLISAFAGFMVARWSALRQARRSQ